MTTPPGYAETVNAVEPCPMMPGGTHQWDTAKVTDDIRCYHCHCHRYRERTPTIPNHTAVPSVDDVMPLKADPASVNVGVAFRQAHLGIMEGGKYSEEDAFKITMMLFQHSKPD